MIKMFSWWINCDLIKLKIFYFMKVRKCQKIERMRENSVKMLAEETYIIIKVIRTLFISINHLWSKTFKLDRSSSLVTKQVYAGYQLNIASNKISYKVTNIQSTQKMVFKNHNAKYNLQFTYNVSFSPSKNSRSQFRLSSSTVLGFS